MGDQFLRPKQAVKHKWPFLDVVTRIHLDRRRKNGWCRERKSTGSALSFVVILDCCSTSSRRKESISGAEHVTLAVGADHLRSPSLSSLVTWSHSRGTWERPLTSLLSAERMWVTPVIYCFEICLKLLQFNCSHNQMNTALCVLTYVFMQRRRSECSLSPHVWLQP